MSAEVDSKYFLGNSLRMGKLDETTDYVPAQPGGADKAKETPKMYFESVKMGKGSGPMLRCVDRKSGEIPPGLAVDAHPAVLPTDQKGNFHLEVGEPFTGTFKDVNLANLPTEFTDGVVTVLCTDKGNTTLVIVTTDSGSKYTVELQKGNLVGKETDAPALGRVKAETWTWRGVLSSLVGGGSKKKKQG